MSIEYMIVLCFIGFTAAFIDSIAGGGGLISLPGLMILGVPPAFALGTNKFASTCASFTSSLTFIKYRVFDYNLLKYLVFGTLIGAAIGVKAVLLIDSSHLKIIIIFLMIFVAIYTLLVKNIGNENKFEGLNKKTVATGLIISLILGFYDGFFGPGTGSFYIFLFLTLLNYDFKISAGNGKILNFVSNITSSVLFFLNGKIMYSVAVPMAIAMILGARLGTKVAIKNGAKLIKPILVSVTFLYAIKMIFDAI
ncbi:TSUP family transporter [Caldanaerobius polysaccharolyticus]|uniref:TSUP family transporter n=1 Tax=Caldanaerobius polysaccharolyticus TaxID=44256 RepID=UPI00047C7B41|nr:TSUP family transporter [Caldanaerobius polysaccharolyticus]